MDYFIGAMAHELHHANQNLDGMFRFQTIHSLQDGFIINKLSELDAMLKDWVVLNEYREINGGTNRISPTGLTIYQSALRQGEEKFAILPAAEKERAAKEYAASQFIKAFWGADSDLALTPDQVDYINFWNNHYNTQALTVLETKLNPPHSPDPDKTFDYYLSSMKAGKDITPDYLRKNMMPPAFYGYPLSISDSEIILRAKSENIVLAKPGKTKEELGISYHNEIKTARIRIRYSFLKENGIKCTRTYHATGIITTRENKEEYQRIYSDADGRIESLEKVKLETDANGKSVGVATYKKDFKQDIESFRKGDVVIEYNPQLAGFRYQMGDNIPFAYKPGDKAEGYLPLIPPQQLATLIELTKMMEKEGLSGMLPLESLWEKPEEKQQPKQRAVPSRALLQRGAER